MGNRQSCYSQVMKTRILLLTFLLGSLQIALAGGNSSLVDLNRVTSVKIEEGKVTIVGDGIVRKRVFTDAEHDEVRIFGQPAQWQVTKVRECTFELVPYCSRSDVAGVPGGGPEDVTPEMQKMIDTQWAGILKTAKTIEAGDAVRIGYQRDRTILLGYKITHIVGEGSLRKVEKGK